MRKEFGLLGRYSFAGILNTLLGYGLIFTLMFLGVGPYLSNVIGYGIGFIISFMLNRNFVFRSKGKYVREGAFFLFFMGVAYGLNFAMLHFLLGVGVNPYVCQVGASATYTISMFLFSKRFVFLTR